MWGIYALLSAALAGANAVVAKLGLRRVDAAVASALRTIVVLAVSATAALIGGGGASFARVDLGSTAILALSGAATAAAWICYFRALSQGNVEWVAAVDKFSIVLTLLGGALCLGERVTAGKRVTMALVTAGVYCMSAKKSTAIDKQTMKSHSWRMWAFLSTALVSASALLSKAGASDLKPETALTIRTGAVLILTWGYLIGKGKLRQVRIISGKTALYLLLSGGLTAFGWLFYFRALAEGGAGEVHAVDKLGIVVTVILARIIFREKLSGRYLLGLVLLVAGILWLYFTSQTKIA